VKKILVIGAGGYVGSHMVRALGEAGRACVAFDDLSSGHREALAGVETIVGDVLSPADLRGAFERAQPDAVMHFCAKIVVPEAVRDPAPYYRCNVTGTLNVLDEMRRAGVRRLVFSSTAAVYGAPARCPIEESHPLAPNSPYGSSKLMAEQQIRDCCAAYGLRATMFRYFNAAGAHRGGGIGESHEPETHLIPNVLRRAADSAAPLELYGHDFPTPDGTAVRDYVHVEDLCRAHLLGLDHMERMADGQAEAFNLGGGVGHSVLAVLRAAEKVTGRRIPFEQRPRRAGDVPELVASIEKAGRVLGWHPQCSSLPEIIQTAWDWQQRRHY
jgi:UDP-glucose 4-epimerase